MNSRHDESTATIKPLLGSALSTLLSVAALWLLSAFPATRLLDQLTASSTVPVPHVPQQAGTPHS
jgi:hypothetical protein